MLLGWVTHTRDAGAAPVAGGGSRRRTLAAAWGALVLLLAAPAAAPAADTTIEFDTEPAGERITTDYADRGVVFAPELTPGAVPASTVQPQVRASEFASTAPNVLDTSGCSGEFCQPSVTAKLSHPRAHVSVRPGAWRAGEGGIVRLTAYDSDGVEVGRATQLVRADASPGLTSPCNFSCELRIDAPGIRYFVIERASGTSRIGVDSLAYEAAPAPTEPSYSLLWSGTVDGRPARVPAVGLRSGFSTSTTVHVDRLGGSSGEVAFSATGLPPGVVAEFSPARTTGDSTTLTLTAATGADVVFDGRTTVVATAADAAAGPSPQRVQVPVAVRPNFGLGGDPRYPAVPAPVVEVAPCTAVEQDVPVFVPAAFGSVDPGFVPQRYFDTLALRVTAVPAGVSASLTPPGLTMREATRTSRLRIETSPGALAGDTPVGLRASAPLQAPADGTVVLRPVSGTVTSVSPAAVRTPQGLQPGTEVVVEGAGFCPDALVRVGNDQAVARPTAISPDGRSLRFRVPRLATSGPLTISAGGARFTAGPSLAVDSYRNTAGFPFANRSSTASFDDLTAFFGEDQTYHRISINPCWPLKCPVKLTTVKDPFAAAIARTSPGTGGICFGMSLTGLKLARGDLALSALPPAGAPFAWALDGAVAPSDAALTLIRRQHLAQYSTAYTKWVADHPARTAPGLRRVVEDLLRAGDPPIMTMSDDRLGHAVTAYDIEDDPDRRGGQIIHVYDSNAPFLAGEDADGVAHRDRLGRSRIVVAPDGGWTFEGLQARTSPPRPWAGSARTLRAIPFSRLRGRLQLSRQVNGQEIAYAEPGVRVAALTRADGTSLLDDAGQPTTPDVVRLSPAEPDAPARDDLLLRGRGPYVQTLDGGGRAFTHRVAGHRFTASVEVPAGPAAQVVLSPSAPSIGWRPAPAAGRARITVLSHERGAQRTAVLSTTGAGEVGWDRARRAVVLRHTGPAATISLTVSGLGGGLPGTFSTGSLRVARGERLTLQPDWRAPGERPARLVRQRGGRRTTLRLANRARRAPGVRLTQVRLSAPRGGRRTVRLGARTGALADGSSLTLSYAVLDGRRVVARGRRTIADTRRSSHRAAFRVRASGRRLRVVATAVVVPAGDATAVRAARRTVRVR